MKELESSTNVQYTLQCLIFRTKYTTQYLIGVKVSTLHYMQLYFYISQQAILQGMFMMPLNGDPLVEKFKQIIVSTEEEIAANLVKLRVSTLAQQEEHEQVLLTKVSWWSNLMIVMHLLI